MAVRRRGRSDEETPKANWLLTYGCLVTQILVFFVMLFALSSVTTEDQLKTIKERIDAYVAENGLDNLIHTDLTHREKGLVVTLSDTFMFKSGKAELANPDALHHIEAIARIIREDPEGRTYPNRISIEGHTDNVPIRPGAEFATNWELSTARATNIARYLVEDLAFQPERTSSSGYAEWHPAEANLADIPEAERQEIPPKELVERANETADQRARNRRVDIVVRRLELWEMQAWREELLKSVSKAVGH